MKVSLTSITDTRLMNFATVEELIIFQARVSNPENQLNMSTAPKLLKYLIDNHHWSPFEMAHMVVCIETSRAIAAQILRHRSFSFQEFSQRYAKPSNFEEVELRLEHETNRQSSSEVLEDAFYLEEVSTCIDTCVDTYQSLVDRGVAKETARMILPLCTQTTMYMSGSIRSWIHYLMIRDEDHVQKEHMLIAREIKKIFIDQFPWTSAALEWSK